MKATFRSRWHPTPRRAIALAVLCGGLLGGCGDDTRSVGSDRPLVESRRTSEPVTPRTGPPSAVEDVVTDGSTTTDAPGPGELPRRTPSTAAPATSRPKPGENEAVVPTTTKPPHPEGFEVTVFTDRRTYPAGTPVRITVRSCNNTTRRYSETFHSPSQLRVRDHEGDVVADDSGVNHPAQVSTVSWEPQQCREGVTEWAQNMGPLHPDYDSREPGPRAAAGRYWAEVEWRGKPEGEPGAPPHRTIQSDPFVLE